MQRCRRGRTSIVFAAVFLFCIGVAEGAESKATLAQQRFEKGLLMMEAGNTHAADELRRALQDLDAYLDEKGSDRAGRAAAYLLRSKCHSMLGDNPHALEDLDRAIELAPEEGENYYLRSFSNAIAGNAELSVADLKTAARKGHQKARVDLTLKEIAW